MASCCTFSWNCQHFHLCFFRFSVRGAELTGREHKDYKEKVLERALTVVKQELQSDLCCCDGERGKHVLLSEASDSNRSHIYYRTNEGNMEETRLVTLSLTGPRKDIYLFIIDCHNAE